MSWPKHYSLVKEHDKHFELHDARDDQKFSIAKKDIHPANQLKIMKMQKFYDGGQVVPDYLSTPTDELSFPKTEPELPFAQRAGQYVGKIGSQAISDGFAPIRALGSAISPALDTAAQFVGGVANGVGNEPIMPQANAETLPKQPGLASATRNPTGQQAAAVPQEQAAPTIPQADTSSFPTVGGLQGAERQYGNALRGEAEAQGKKDEQIGDLEQMRVWADQNRQKIAAEKMEEWSQRNDQLTQDVADHKTDPNRLWNNSSTGSKVSSILGILLSGIGAGLQKSTHNMAMELIDKNIDRDIAAQKDDLGKKQNLLSEHMKQYGNIKDAEAAARLDLQATVDGQMKMIAAKSNNPILQQQVEQKIAENKIRLMPLQAQLAQVQAQKAQQQQINSMLQGKDLSNMDPAQLVELKVPEHLRKDVYAEIQKATDAKKTKESFMSSFRQAAKDVRFMTGGNPLYGSVLTPPSIKAMDLMALPLIHDKEGRVNEFEQKTVQENYPKWGDSDKTVAKKEKAMSDFFDQKSSAPIAKGNGIDLSRFNATRVESTKAQPVARETKDGRIGLYDPETKAFLRYK